ncbi:putative B3 domain-containing protein, partial [Cucurbita argyrosperma subsp. sororia]
MGLRRLKNEISFLDLDLGVHIPRRKRGSSGSAITKRSISMMECATILIAFSNSVTHVLPSAYLPLRTTNTKPITERKPISERKPITKRKPITERKPRKKRCKQTPFPTTPDMPAAMRDRIGEMGAYQIQLAIQKQLQDTDMNKNHGRLSFPAKKLKVDFATEEERRVLKQQENGGKKGMNVMIVDPLLRESSICLKLWKIGSGDSYCLMTQWNWLVEQNGFKSGDHVQLWSFRKDELEAETQTMVSRLCFAMVKLDATTASA